MSLFDVKSWFNGFEQRKQLDSNRCIISRELAEEYFDQARITKSDRLTDTKIIAVDFETTGLNSAEDRIISMGFCPIDNNRIKLANCFHLVVKPDKDLDSFNVTIHGLTDDQVTGGVSAKTALSEFLTQTKGAVILAHYHKIEKEFIQQLAKKLIGLPLPLSFLDTFEIAHKLKTRRHQPITNNALRLFNLRKDYGLPNYNAHNALEDAIATAELFLALLAETGQLNESTKLRELGLLQYK